MTLDDLFRAAEPHLIGIWKFRERGKEPVWCATVLENGAYYDVDGSDGAGTIRAILEKVLTVVG